MKLLHLNISPVANTVSRRFDSHERESIGNVGVMKSMPLPLWKVRFDLRRAGGKEFDEASGKPLFSESGGIPSVLDDITDVCTRS